MVITNPGKVTDRILLLGVNESSVYILKGKDEYAVLGGGMVHMVPEMIEQLKQFQIEEERIKRIFILHSHFDHCGVVPFLKKHWPWAKITASQRAKELLAAPKVIEAIQFMNQALLKEKEREDQAKDLGLGFSGIQVEEVVKEGDKIPCGDLTIEIIEVPGHSSCSIAAYVAEEKAMFGSDAGGIPFGDQIFTCANSNFDKYQESLEKMAGYEIDVYLAEHYGARTGKDASSFLNRSIDFAKNARAVLEASYARTKDINQSTEEMTDMLMENAPDDFLHRDIIALVTGQMLRYISKQQ
ncbi:MAG: MBL fold metallo-hydrolase [Thermodesulfobacteriota bacterium]|nr:MBL fold metallo-hydrolase [Thermodesulfobacteriota bacterium]